MPRHKTNAEKTLPSIDWQRLLVCRESPPRQWWVGEAKRRNTSDSELRAEAALSLLLIPFDEEPFPGSPLVQLPDLANRYRRAFESEGHFAVSMLDEEKQLHPDIYRVAVHSFLLFDAANRAVNPPPVYRGESQPPLEIPPLVPELKELTYKASLVVKALRKEWKVETDLTPGPLLRDLPGHTVKRSATPRAENPGRATGREQVQKESTDSGAHPAERFLL